MVSTVKLPSSGSSPGLARSAAFPGADIPTASSKFPSYCLSPFRVLFPDEPRHLASNRRPPLCFYLTLGYPGFVRPASTLRLTVPLLDFTSVSGVFSRHQSANSFRNRRLPYASLPLQPSLPDSRCGLKPDVAISPRRPSLDNHSEDSVSFAPQRRPFGTPGSKVGSDPVV